MKFGRRLNEEPEPPSPGWDAITQECGRAYPGQAEPKHFASLIKWRFGGNGPLDGISVYDGGAYWHLVTYGLSELYEKELDNPNISGYGMEFTFKLKKGCYENEDAELKNLCGILQSISRVTFTKGELFLPFEYVSTGQSEGIDVRQLSQITGFFTLPDQELKAVQTPNGRVEFVCFVGACYQELLALRERTLTVRELYERLGTDVTDFQRESVVEGPVSQEQ